MAFAEHLAAVDGDVLLNCMTALIDETDRDTDEESLALHMLWVTRYPGLSAAMDGIKETIVERGYTEPDAEDLSAMMGFAFVALTKYAETRDISDAVAASE